MTRIYVAGAYSDDNVLGVLKNIGRGQEMACKLFQLGFAPFVPWFDKEFVFANWRDEFRVSDFYDYSIAWLLASDAVFVVPNHPGMKNWEESTGTLEEIRIAKAHDIPVFFDINNLLSHYGK